MIERTVKLLILVVAITAFFFLAAAQAGPCTTEEIQKSECFTSIPSGYTFRIVKSGPCADVLNVNGFPHVYENSLKKLYCYSFEVPAAGKSSKPTISVQIPLSFYGPNFTPLVPAMNPGITPAITQFAFTQGGGCQGDSNTGFESGDREECAMRWTFQTFVSGGTINRFFYYVDPSVFSSNDIAQNFLNLGVAPQVMAVKISSSLETGMILGADGSASPYTPKAAFVCEHVGGKNVKILKDANNCVTEVALCQDSDQFCGGDVTPTATAFINSPPFTLTNPPQLNPGNICGLLPPRKLAVKIKDDQGNTIFETMTLRELGTAGGNNFCKEGHLTLKGSSLSLIRTGSGLNFTW